MASDVGSSDSTQNVEEDASHRPQPRKVPEAAVHVADRSPFQSTSSSGIVEDIPARQIDDLPRQVDDTNPVVEVPSPVPARPRFESMTQAKWGTIVADLREQLAPISTWRRAWNEPLQRSDSLTNVSREASPRLSPVASSSPESDFRQWHLICMFIVSINCLLMGIAELIIEIIVLSGVTPKVPFRLEFTFLTALSFILGAQSVWGMLRHDPDFTKNTLFASGCLEFSLIVCDVEFLFEMESVGGGAAAFTTSSRAPFIVITFGNLVTLVCIFLSVHHRLGLRNRDKTNADGNASRQPPQEQTPVGRRRPITLDPNVEFGAGQV